MTTKLKILMEDWIMDALVPITYSGEVKALPAANLRDPDPTKPWQVTGTTANIIFDLSGVANNYDIGLFIGNHNLTSTVVIHAQFHTSNAWGAPTVDNTLSLADFIDDSNYLNTDELFNKLFFWLTSAGTLSYDWMRITFSDADNTDGYLRFGLIGVGPVGGDENFSYLFAKSQRSGEQDIELSVGESATQQAKIFDTVSISFSNVSMNMLARMRRWISEGGYQRERWIALSPNAEEGATLTYYGRITQFSGFDEVLKTSTRALNSFGLTIADLCPSKRNIQQLSYTTYDGFTEYAHRSDVFMVLMMPREAVTTWTLDASNTYYATYPVNSTENWLVAQVYEDGFALTKASSLVNCKATAGTWWYDLETERRVYVHATDEADPDTHVIHVAPLFSFCTAIPAEAKFCIMSATVDGNALSNVLFEQRIEFGEISWSMDSAFIGFARPTLSRVEIFNGKRRYSDTAGVTDKWAERFQWRNTECWVLHGDGGIVFTFPTDTSPASTEFAYLGRFVVRSVSLTDDKFIVEIDSQISELNKKIPPTYYTETYENEEDSGI